jgi:hypothetical protein
VVPARAVAGSWRDEDLAEGAVGEESEGLVAAVQGDGRLDLDADLAVGDEAEQVRELVGGAAAMMPATVMSSRPNASGVAPRVEATAPPGRTSWPMVAASPAKCKALSTPSGAMPSTSVLRRAGR